MKALALAAASLAFAAPASAMTTNAADMYFAANATFSLVVTAVAAAAMFSLRAQKREPRKLVPVSAPAWRKQVISAVEADLAQYVRRFDRAA